MEIRNIIALTGIFVAIFLFFANQIKNDLKEDTSREYFLQKLEQPAYSKLYYKSVDRALRWADGYFYSSNPFSITAFLSILPWTLTYCPLFFFLGWVAGSSGGFGSAQLLPEGLSQWVRLLIFVVFLLIAISPLWAMKTFWKRAYKSESVRAILMARFGNIPDYKNLSLSWFVIVVVIIQPTIIMSSNISFLLFSIHDLTITAFAYPIYISLIILSSWLLGCLPVKTAVDLQLFKVGFISASILLLIGFLATFITVFVKADDIDEKLLPYIASLTLFCFALPVACAISDYMAWAIARTLGRQVTSSSGVLVLFLQVFLNAISAIFCTSINIVVLILAIDFLADTYNLSRQFFLVDLDIIISDLENSPFQLNNAWILGPLMMTMIPVFLHLATILVGFLTMLTPKILREAIAKRITGTPPSAQLTLPAIYFAAMPWISIAFLIGLIITVYGGINILLPDFNELLLRLARNTHDFVTSHHIAIKVVLLGILALYFHFAILWEKKLKHVNHKS